MFTPQAPQALRRLTAVMLCAMLCAGAAAQLRRNTAYENYLNQYRDIAIQQMLRYGIPASITLAQGVFESGAGMSALATRGNNHFGIKCHDWTGATMRQDDDARHECFRVYRNAAESYEDHSRFLAQQQRYRSLFRLRRTDYKGWARGLKACGYATNPRYADKLIEIIQTYRLYEYDTATAYDRFLAQRTGKEDQRTAPAGRLHPIHKRNDNYWLAARQGDTFKSIAKEVGISARKLAKYNERDKKDVLAEGDVVYLRKKRNKAEKRYRQMPHTVRAGESMYSIAQDYGIRLKALYKKNNLTPDYKIRVGDRLRVY